MMARGCNKLPENSFDTQGNDKNVDVTIDRPSYAFFKIIFVLVARSLLDVLFPSTSGRHDNYTRTLLCFRDPAFFSFYFSTSSSMRVNVPPCVFVVKIRNGTILFFNENKFEESSVLIANCGKR